MLALELLELAYEFQPTRVAMLSDVGRTPFVYEELKRGSEYSIPRWFADVLRKLGKAETTDEAPIHSKILKVKFAHSTSAGSRQLPAIPEFFYVNSRRELIAAMEKAHQSLDLDTLSRVSKAVKAFNDIAGKRLSTIVKAVSLGGYASIERSLSYEEKLLATLLSKMLSEWKEAFIVVKEGG